MSYSPLNAPADVPRSVRNYVDRELRAVSRAFGQLDNLRLPALAAPPERPVDGLLVYANGTDWNPGSGAGFYGYEAGAWVKL